MGNANIAVQLYSLRDDMKEDFYGTLKKVKEYGYTGVEFAGLFDHDPLEVKQMCEELGLIPISAHVPVQTLMADLEGTVECYSKLGCKYMVIPSLPPELRPGHEGFLTTLVELMHKLGAALAEKDMVLQYHNHDFEFVKIDDEYPLDILYRTVPPQVLQTQLDTCWVKVGGVDPVAYIRQYSGRTPTVHLKDFVGTRTQNMYKLIGVNENEKQEAVQAFAFRVLGQGVQDFPAIVKAAQESGAQWFIVELDRAPEGYTPAEAIEASVRYLKEKVFC